jgi:hypothetical protein
VVVAVSGPTCSVPDVAFAPVQPWDAVHAVAFVLDHVSVAVWPEVIDGGFAEIVTVGLAPGADFPPLPPQPESTAARPSTVTNPMRRPICIA